MQTRVRTVKVMFVCMMTLLAGSAAWALTSAAGTSTNGQVYASSASRSATVSAGSTNTTDAEPSTTVTTLADTTLTKVGTEGRATVRAAGCKPRYGYGDKNHCHTGPPGQNKKAAAANATTSCKPGNGYGDKNHCHTGPPGQNK